MPRYRRTRAVVYLVLIIGGAVPVTGSETVAPVRAAQDGTAAALTEPGPKERGPEPIREPGGAAASNTNAPDATETGLRERANLIADEANSLGGWESWAKDLGPFRSVLRKKLAESSKEYWGIEGRNGFIFNKGSVKYVSTLPPQPNRSASDNDGPHAVIVDFDRHLRARGIHLVFAIAPSKIEIYPEKLTEAAPSGFSVALNSKRLIWDLLNSGVDAIDLYDPIYKGKSASEDDLYIPTDTHWSPEAIPIAASLLADHLRRTALPPDSLLGRQHCTLGERSWTHIGDLVGKGGISDSRKSEYPPIELMLRPVLESEGRVYRADPRSPILIVGDSFVAKYAAAGAGIGAHLARELGFALTQLTSAGGGPSVPCQLTRQGPENLRGRRVVIWMMVSRYLGSATSWKLMELRAGP